MASNIDVIYQYDLYFMIENLLIWDRLGAKYLPGGSIVSGAPYPSW